MSSGGNINKIAIQHKFHLFLLIPNVSHSFESILKLLAMLQSLDSKQRHMISLIDIHTDSMIVLDMHGLEFAAVDEFCLYHLPDE